MTHTVTITKLFEGQRHVTMHVYLACDGASGEITDQVIVNPTTFTPPLAAKATLAIEEIWYDFSGFGVRLEYDNLVDTVIWTCTSGNGNHIDLRENLGGLADRSGLDGTGNLQFSTYGFDAVKKQGTMIVKLKKT